MKLPIKNRRTAGLALAQQLEKYHGQDDVMVLALPRGGVPVALEVATALQASLDLMLVRKLGTPRQRELAMGAIASGNVRIMNEDLVRHLGIDVGDIETAEKAERLELQRREQAYRGDRPWPNLEDHCVILIDDGLATGATMRAAIAAVHKQHPRRVVVAVPLAPADTIATLRNEVDEVVCLATPEPFMAISQWYEDFPQVNDEQVREMLIGAWAE